MLPMVIAALAGAGLGVLQGQEQQKNWKEQQKIEAMKERWSAFTGHPGQNIQRPSQMAPIMQGGMAGAMFGQQLKPDATGNLYAPTTPDERLSAESAPGFTGPPSAASGYSQGLVGQPQMNYNAYADNSVPTFMGPPRSAMMRA